MNRPDSLPNISRRRFLQLAGATTSVALGLTPSVDSIAACAPSVIVKNYDVKTATLNMIGQRINVDQNGNSSIEGPSAGVDLRLSLAQDPRNSYQIATFKADGQFDPNWATLIGMGPIENGMPIPGRKLELYGKDFSFRGNWTYDTSAWVEECGVLVERDALLFNVERAVKENGVVNHYYEFSFGVVPDCGPKRQKYLSVVRQPRLIVPTLEPTIAVPTATPRVQTVRPSQTPIREIGEPTESPAQIPLRSVGEPV